MAQTRKTLADQRRPADRRRIKRVSRPYVVWLAASSVYIIAIAGRTSFGVAGLSAVERFSVNASTLALFTVVQLALYTVLQIPVGMILDKMGVRRVLCTGALMMGVGQLILGCSTSIPVALGARVLIGAGDATVFVSVVRLIPSWFPAHRIPLFTQCTGQLGALGQIISSIPFAYFLSHMGWSFTFTLLAVFCVVACVVAFAFVVDSPQSSLKETDRGGAQKRSSVQVRGVEEQAPSLRDTLKTPGVKLAFWTHFATCCPSVVFPLLWGVPFLHMVNGWSTQKASAVLVIQTVAGIPLGPLVGRFVTYHPWRRIPVVLGTIAVTVAVWLLVLSFSEGAPLWLVAVLMVVLALNYAASGLAFDFARVSVDSRRISTAIGVANMGGFSAALLVAWLIGLLLDLQAPGGQYEAVHYRIAMMAQLLTVLVGLVGFLYYRGKIRDGSATAKGVIFSLVSKEC